MNAAEREEQMRLILGEGQQSQAPFWEVRHHKEQCEKGVWFRIFLCVKISLLLYTQRMSYVCLLHFCLLIIIIVQRAIVCVFRRKFKQKMECESDPRIYPTKRHTWKGFTLLRRAKFAFHFATFLKLEEPLWNLNITKVTLNASLYARFTNFSWFLSNKMYRKLKFYDNFS